MEKKRTLTQRNFIKAYIENGGNETKAYLALNPEYKGKNARKLGNQIWTNIDIPVSELLDKMGITDFHLNQKLKEGLDATKVISVIPIPPKEAKPGTRDLPDANSKNIEFIDVPDFNVRFKYVDMGYKLKGKYPVDTSRFELTGKGGEPIRYIIETTYKQPEEGKTEKTKEKDAI